MGRRKRRGGMGAISLAKSMGVGSGIKAAKNLGTMSQQQGGGFGGAATNLIGDSAPNIMPGRGRRAGGHPSGKNKSSVLGRRGGIDRGRGRSMASGREYGGGYRNRGFGMGRESRGYGMGHQRDVNRAHGFGRHRGNVMGMPFFDGAGQGSYGGQRTFALGDQAWGRGGTGGFGPRGFGGRGRDLIGDAASNIMDYRQGRSQFPEGRPNMASVNNRRRMMRNRRNRFINQQRAANRSVGQVAAVGGGGGGSYSNPYTGGGMAYQGKSFSKKVGTKQGAFRIGNPANNIASKNNKLAINQKS